MTPVGPVGFTWRSWGRNRAETEAVSWCQLCVTNQGAARSCTSPLVASVSWQEREEREMWRGGEKKESRGEEQGKRRVPVLGNSETQGTAAQCSHSASADI